MMIHLIMDNSTAIAYINHLGGTRSSTLCSIATDLRSWCQDRKLFLLASHVPGVQSTLADHLSRSLVDRHDWMLNKSVFKKQYTLWGPLVVDLFATRVTTQLPRFFSWKLDPQAEAIDAFVQTWTGFRGYANPPWSLIGRCIQHIKGNGSASNPSLAITTMVCSTSSSVAGPAEDTPGIEDLIVTFQETELPFPDGLPQLVAWLVSGDTTARRACRPELSHYCSPLGETQPIRTTFLPGTFGRGSAQTITETLFLLL